MLRKTVLHSRHVALGARMVDFGGWDMPVHYGSQIDEHHAVRRNAGIFDVSHMRVVDVAGRQSTDYLRHLLANDVARLRDVGSALYSCMLNDRGGVIDDLIVYRTEHGYRVVVNAGTADSDLAWMGSQAKGFDVSIDELPALSILAVQGPKSIALAGQLWGEDGFIISQLRRFEGAALTRHSGWYCGRTGYTGEDGFELMLPSADAESVWNELMAVGAAPCGLGARDTLRLEAGMCLYGQDLDSDHSPLESGLAWTVMLRDQRTFVGRDALEDQIRVGLSHEQVGLVLNDRGILRAHMSVITPKVPA
jgi:aminomethyltransferase